MRYRCRYCGQPIKKFLIGWIHDYDLPTGIPGTLHVAKPSPVLPPDVEYRS